MHPVVFFPLLAACASPLARVQRTEPLAGAAGMPAWHASGGDWSIQDGMLRQTANWYSENAWEQTAHAFLASPALSDFSIGFQFRVDPRSRGVSAAQFLFRATDSRTYYLIQFSARAGGVFLVREDHNNHWIAVKRAYGVSMPTGRWHNVHVRAAGQEITVAVDGTEVLAAADGALRAGLVGFGASQAVVAYRDIRLQGETVALTQPWHEIGGKIVKPDAKVICEDAGAGGYEAFPDICRCANGDLLCVMYAGYDHVSFPRQDLPRGARVCAVRSTDEGHTWTPAQIVADTPWDDRDPSVCCLSDGTLICNWFTYYGGFKEPEGDKTFKYKELWLCRSTDNGHTWTQPELIPHLAGAYWACSSPIIELVDGTLLWPVYREYRDPLRNWSAVVRSTDKGKTWSEPYWVDETNDDNDEPAVLQMPDGRVLCLMRANSGDSMWYSWSEDQGLTWTPSQKTGFPGHCPYLFRTEDGILLLGHRLPNTSMHYSLDDGRTWSANVTMDATIGAYPSMVALREGAVLFAYYEEGPGSSIRAQKIRATRDGIVRVPWDED